MLEGYSIREEIHRGRRRIVYRAERATDESPVIIKSAVADASELEVNELRREFEILSSLSIDGVIKARELSSSSDGLHLVLEDCGGVTLAEYLRSAEPDLARLLDIAINVTKVVASLHDQKVLHKDINPTNILVEPSSGKTTLIDFSIATRQAEEHPIVTHPHVLEGTLAYLSPEQSGRMNRSVDYRSDFYSLGVTLFEVFTGQLPFQAGDPLELVHSHMAVPAPSPTSVRPELPVALGLVIGKLLEKAPEDRYQSAAGILGDLRACLRFVEDETASDDFIPGRQDVRDRFLIPKRIYGRQNEIDTLLKAFERVGRCGAELVFVSGYSGIGKSALVQSLHGPITARRGYFVKGKFDLMQRAVPYSAIVEALGGLVRQILTEPDEMLTGWREKIQAAVGESGRLVIDVIPEVEHVIGPQKAVPVLGGEEAKNRFRRVFLNFVRVFSQREHPLVIFVDDLQWADRASLALMENILADERTQHLLWIGAYRDNEVDASHPLLATEAALKASQAAVSRLTLGPLGQGDVADLIVDTLHRDRGDLEPLLRLVHTKTAGNPFFLQQFLKTLHRKGGLSYKRARNQWHWDIAAIDAMNITDNVVDLMVSRLRELAEPTQRVLRLAACIGNVFDIDTLRVITTDPASKVLSEIAPAIEAGLVVVDSSYERSGLSQKGEPGTHSRLHFQHDRVQQAAYSLLDESLRRQVHLRIGRQLLSSLSQEGHEDRIFEIVDHLNIGHNLIEREAERRELACLNLEAARKSIAATAYDAANAYAAAGRSCLPETCWESDYELTKGLSRVEAEADYLRGEFERSQGIINSMLLRLRTPVERAELHVILVTQRTLCGQYGEAAEAARNGLAMLGVDLPDENLESAWDAELALFREGLGQRQPLDLLELPEMTSAGMQVALQLLASLCPLCYITDPLLCRVVTAKMVNISLAHGNSPASAIGYAFFGLQFTSFLHDYKGGHSFGLLAMTLAERFRDSSQVCKTTHVFCAFINHWSRPLREFDEVNVRGFQAGLESGELQYAGYHRYNRALCLFHQGMILRNLLSETEKWLRFGRQTRNQHATDSITAVRLAARDLSGETPGPAEPSERKDGSGFLRELEARNAMPAWCHYCIMKSQALYLYGQIEEAGRYAAMARKRLSFISGHISVAVHTFYESLILLAVATREGNDDVMERLRCNLSRLRAWADSSPDNFRHKSLLVEAELARVEGEDWSAADLYDRAIREAARAGFLQDEALARERAGLFWLAKGRQKISALYLGEALRAYQRWGASKKASLLAERHADLLAGSASVAGTGGTTSIPFFTLVSSSGAAMDFVAVMKASQAISGEIDLDGLVKKLVRIAVETAGAQTGHLLLAKEDRLFKEAVSTLDQPEIRFSPSIPLDAAQDVPPTVVNYVTRTREILAVADAVSDPRFAGDEVIQRLRLRSILALPIMMRVNVIGLLYLEHRLVPNAFTSDRVRILQSLAAQAAISLQNAHLYEERKVAERKLRDAVEELQELKNRLEVENLYFREEIKIHHKFEEIVGRSSGIQQLLNAVETVAPTDATVLILGETGTGKELVARAIHDLSACKDRPLIKVNCAALPAGLIESELFGHEKGAFTGAVSRKVGRFELANGGTIFLDEIGDLPLELQAKLLRVLQEGEFERVGGAHTLRVVVRVIAATNRDLIKSMSNGDFREDLYYRLSVFPLQVPALRERRDDIPSLVRHFVLKCGLKLGKRVESIPQQHMHRLKDYDWPGNVRELENVIERAMILSQGSALQLEDWAARVRRSPSLSSGSTLEDLEREHILRTLKQTSWRLGGERGAARILGMKRTTLQSRMRKLHIRRDN